MLPLAVNVVLFWTGLAYSDNIWCRVLLSRSVHDSLILSLDGNANKLLVYSVLPEEARK